MDETTLDTEGAFKLVRKIKDVVQFVKYSPRELSAALAAVTSLAGGAWLGWAGAARPAQLAAVVDEALWQALTLYGSFGLYILAVLLIIWIVFRILRRLSPPPKIENNIQATAIKGPLSFGPHDAGLFRQLRREDDIATLLNHVLSDQISVLVVSGESGAGKTSLLRAGLPATLKAQDPPIEYHYWEAVPNDVEKRLLSAVQDGWQAPPDAGPPQKLIDIFGPDASSVRRAIVLDQFEQLSPDKRQHRPIFQMLKHAVMVASPPYKTTLVVAFRRDYMPTWTEFEHDELAGRRQPVMPVRLFAPAQAKEVMAVIAESANFEMDDALANDLIDSMENEDGRVSPVDIGITLLALSERAVGKPDRRLDKGDYRIKGGATGLLAEYISNQLERYQASERSKILLALLELADLGKDQRLPEGRTPEQLAEKMEFPGAMLELHLKDLASPQVRLLEALPSGAYRLPHERLIPALRQLSGLILAEVEQTARMFDQTYSDWRAGQRRPAFLLRGSRLRNVLRHREQIRWGSDQEEKEKFLRQSLRGRNRRYAIGGAGLALACGIGFLLKAKVEDWQAERDLDQWKEPAALFEKQNQLTSLEISSPLLTHLRWIRHCFKELSISAPSLDKLSGLPSCDILASLKLNLSNNSSISSLDELKEMRGLTSLELIPGESIGSLDALKELKGLTSLTLDLSDSSSISSLDALKELKGLTSLTLNLRNNSSIGSLDALQELKGLTALTLDLNGSSAGSLDALKELKGLTSLTLDLSSLGGNSVIGSLDALKELKGLTSLTLNLSDDSSIDSLDALKELNGLTSLTLDLSYNSSIGSLDALKELKGLTSLALYLSYNSSIGSLDALKELKGLTSLTLDLSGNSSIGSLDALKELKGLTSLTLDLSYNSSIGSLDALKELKGLTSLTLDLSNNSSIARLDALKELKGLTSLTLDINHSAISTLETHDLGVLRTVRIARGDHYELDRLSKSVVSLSLVSR